MDSGDHISSTGRVSSASSRGVVDDILDKHVMTTKDDNTTILLTTTLADNLQCFYSRYNTGYIDKAWMIANMYDNRRKELWLKLGKKYGLAPFEAVELLKNIYNCDDRRDDALMAVFNDDDYIDNHTHKFTMIRGIMMNLADDYGDGVFMRAHLWRNLLFNNNREGDEDVVVLSQKRGRGEHDDINNNDDDNDIREASYRKKAYTALLSDIINITDSNNNADGEHDNIDHDDDDHLIIRRDLKRTMRNIPFFNNKQQEEEQDDDDVNDSRIDVMERVLLVYTTSTGIKYVQGMNQICALLYYVLRDEADTFWAFRCIIDSISSIYIPQLDHTQDGIYSQVDEIKRLLCKYDPILYKHLEDVNIPLITIAIRWLTTLFTLDIADINDIMKIWDIIILSNRYNQLSYYLLCLSTAYIIMNPIRSDILCNNDANTSLQLLSQCNEDYTVEDNNLIWVSLGIMAVEKEEKKHNHNNTVQHQ
ncbi:hypothetical protein FOZ61_009328 [Perkinsus olseni]|uniref:Rab-GAP TBC domain-containing protein n=1 Tax=Perkinsus olseni TaxID=32597 RepID=A0A7J6L182_PEROL|nr:hypothetical protein FOZ61_009328 [Perkinsus olseni]